MKTRWGRLAFGVEDEEYTLVELMVLNDESSLNLWTVGKKIFSCWENSNSALRKRSPGWQIYRSMILMSNVLLTWRAESGEGQARLSPDFRNKT